MFSVLVVYCLRCSAFMCLWLLRLCSIASVAFPLFMAFECYNVYGLVRLWFGVFCVFGCCVYGLRCLWSSAFGGVHGCDCLLIIAFRVRGLCFVCAYS